ncbi:MAG TPA: aminoglycoside phosphotransferase family protein [Vicinamibacterales bacterium]|nr:aminoglycoside phosphotransferase family protein [Vicinamibacterales bacterium]
MKSVILPHLPDRVAELIREWGVVAEHTRETPDSILVFGTREDQAVVVKVIKRLGDEWQCGPVLEAFNGTGVVRMHSFVDGAVVMERLRPGHSLADLALQGRDEQATEILAQLIRQMVPHQAPRNIPTVQHLAGGFRRYLVSGDEQIPKALVEHAQQRYLELDASQTRIRLLHGDLHHYNVLFDTARGWLAIDPKGVVGELEYEIGAALRNPCERPDLFAVAQTIDKRLRVFETVLGLDSSRALAWGFSQAVLAAIWCVEDGCPVEAGEPFLALARAIQPMLA